MGKIVRITGAEHQHDKLVHPEIKASLQDRHNKVVIARRHHDEVIGGHIAL